MNSRLWILLAAIFGASGVGLGAYHAHGLQKLLEKHEPKIESDDIQKRMDNCETAVRYQMYHALALLGLGVLSLLQPRTGLKAAGALFSLGIIGFSGGLYLFVFTGNIVHWAIVPLGGVLLIAGWVAVAVSAVRISTNHKPPVGEA